MSDWIDVVAEKAHKGIDWLQDLGQRGNQRRVRALKKNGELLFEASLTNTVIALLLALLILPVSLLVLLVAWLLGYRVEITP